MSNSPCTTLKFLPHFLFPWSPHQTLPYLILIPNLFQFSLSLCTHSLLFHIISLPFLNSFFSSFSKFRTQSSLCSSSFQSLPFSFSNSSFFLPYPNFTLPLIPVFLLSHSLSFIPRYNLCLSSLNSCETIHWSNTDFNSAYKIKDEKTPLSPAAFSASRSIHVSRFPGRKN